MTLGVNCSLAAHENTCARQSRTTKPSNPVSRTKLSLDAGGSWGGLRRGDRLLNEGDRG
jgi:hypothetical protein